MVYFTFYGAASFPMQIRSLVPAIWTMLSALPSPNSLQEFWIRFRPLGLGLQLSSLLGFLGNSIRLDNRWLMFPNLKVIKLIFAVDDLHCSDLLLEKLHRLEGFRALEEKGVVKVMIINKRKLESYDHFVLDTIGHDDRSIFGK